LEPGKHDHTVLVLQAEGALGIYHAGCSKASPNAVVSHGWFME